MEGQHELRGMQLDELKNLVQEQGFPPYRGEQIFLWIHGKGARDFQEMTDLPAELRTFLLEETRLQNLKMVERVRSDDGVIKFLWELFDGLHIESVIIKHEKRTTLCASTQVGCRFNCPICATGKMGKKRDLTAGEITAQVIEAQNVLGRDKNEENIKNVVFMGMGEPLDNLENVLRSIELFNHPMGTNIGSRRMVISTCGIVPAIYELVEKNIQSVLAVSLHAPNDELRDELVPLNKKYPLQELLTACKSYFDANRRRISFEYALFDGVNDSIECAQELQKLLKGFPAHINLIPANPVQGAPYKESPGERVKAFYDELKKSRLDVSLREPRGRSIESACGQLYPTI